MKTKTVILIVIMVLFNTTLALAGNSLPFEDNNKELYLYLARNFKNAGSLTDVNGVLQEVLAAVGQYQIEELEKMNPNVKKITHMELSLIGSPATKGEELIPQNYDGKKEELGQVKATKSKKQRMRVRANAASRTVVVEYGNFLFDSETVVSPIQGSFDVSVKRQFGKVNGKVNYNSGNSRVETSASKNLAENVYLRVSSARNLISAENYAGFTLKVSW